MKFNVYYFPDDDFQNKVCVKTDILCRQDLIDLGVQLFETISDNVELVLLDFYGTLILDDEYLKSLVESSNLLIYQKSSSQYYELYFLLKRCGYMT